MKHRLALATVFAVVSAWSFAGIATAQPKTLEDCYLNVAMTKSTADMVYLAREICDAAFNRFPRSLTVLTPKTSDCDEWWFDQNGRSEDADRYCALSESSEKTWKLACRWKSTRPDAYSFVELRENGGRMEPVAPARGKAMGEVFGDLSACVEKKLGGRPAN